MTTLAAKSDGTFAVKPKGKICYCFKGMYMHPEPATVVLKSDGILTVSRDSDGQLFDFIWSKKRWLLKNNLSRSSLLFGTQFTFDSENL